MAAAAKEPDSINSDVVFRGNVTILSGLTLPTGVVGDSNIPAGANVSADKLQQKPWREYSRSGNATSETIPLHVCRGAAGLVVDFYAGYVAAPTGSGNVTIDLQKGGVTILSGGNITLVAGTGNRTLVAGTLAGGGNTTLVPGDWLDAVITANAGNGTVPSGLHIGLRVKESPV